MSEMIRSGGVGRCVFILCVLFGSLVVCSGQDQAAQTSINASDAKQEAASPVAAPAQAAPAAPAPEVSESGSKKKASAKNSKNSQPTGSGQVTTTAVQKDPYVIGPEDVLSLNVLHQADVTQILDVRPDGYVSVRFGGEIKAAGLTTQQLADVITEKLKTYFNNPEVNIQVVKINSKKYYISGEVRKGGAYPLTAPKTIYEALIEAGGLADFAKSTKIYVLRGQEKLPFNYKEVSKGKHLQQNVLLQNGDVVVVP